MRANWQHEKIADVCSVLTDGNWIESKDQSPDGIRLIQTGNIGNGVFKDKGDKARFISEDTFDRLSCTEIFEGDVLVSRLPEPIGRSCILPKLEQRTITAVDCSILRFKKELLNKFFVYFTLSTAYDRALKNYITGSSRKRISRSNLGLIKVPVPSIEEQQRIVEELDLLTGIIDKKNVQLRDLDALAQSIFYEMFGNPVTNDKGWPKNRIGELVHLYNGRAFKPSDWTESGLPIVRIQNLNSPDSPYNYYDGVVDESYLLKGGELLYAWSGTPGTSFGAHIWKDEKAVLNQHIFKVLFDEKYLNKLYFLYQLNLSVSSLFDQTHGGVGLKHITKGTLENQFVPLPNMELQKSFEQKVLAIDSEKDRLKCSLLQTKTLLASRMSAYFNTE